MFHTLMRAWQFQKLALKQRLTIGIGAMFLPLILLGVGAFISFEGTIRSFESTDNATLEKLFPLANLEALIQQAPTSAEVCLSDRVQTECDRYRQLSQEIDQMFTTLLATPSDLPEQRVLIQTAKIAWQQSQSSYKKAITASSQRLTPQMIENLEQSVQQSADSLDQLYKLMTHLQLADNLAQAKKVRQRVNLIIATMFGLGLGVAGLSGWAMARSILLPLNALKNGANRLGEGDLSHRINLPTTDEFGQLASTLNQMAARLEQSQVELRYSATMDGLTGVYNRQEFNRLLQAELERSQRYGHPCSLIMIDIDHFKKLNDTYGHPAGDEALRCFASLIKQQIRPADQIARYGGEEFSIILPETSNGDAFYLAERLRQAIAAHTIQITQWQTVKITSSIGIAVFPNDADSASALISASDQALYIAKRSGRNRVSRYNTETTFIQ